MSTPELSLRMPAEWEPHAATWLAWPHAPSTWPGRLDRIPSVWAQMVRALAPGEDVHILVNGSEMELAARRTLHAHRADAPNAHFHHIPTNDAWIRDFGPTFVKRGEETVLLNWGYNAWGEKYPPWDQCDAVPKQIADLLGLPMITPGMILEGGSIEVNGVGALLTTEQCLLNPNRNPTRTRSEIENQLCEKLGVHSIHWLGEGVAGDDTDGHIDDLTRFVSEDTLVTVVEPDTGDVNHRALAENWARLEASGFNVIDLPMPRAVFDGDVRLPASPANFYIGNAAVLVPTFNDAERDRVVTGILRECFPGREIVGIDCTEMVAGLGAIHCVTQQQPR
jgi:agmatine deiminase